MVTIASLMVALATAQVPSADGGDAVILETIVSSTTVDRGDAEQVEQFLAERIQDAWDVEVSLTPPIREGGRHFYVTLDWRAPTSVFIRVAERDVVHVDRRIEIADPESGRAILWLSIRSSIERALAAMPEAPTVAEMIESMAREAETETATASDVAPTPPETPAPPPVPAAAPTATVVERVDPDPIDPRLYASFGSMWARKQAPSAGTWSVSALIKGGIEGGLSSGPSVQLHYVLGRWLTVGGELGYYSVNSTNDVTIEHFPITALASMQPDLELPLEFGARAVMDIQAVVQPNNTDAGVRLLVGPYARSALPFYVGDGDQASFVAELRMDFALVRGRYALPNNESYVDPLIGIAGAIGVEYRWR